MAKPFTHMGKDNPRCGELMVDVGASEPPLVRVVFGMSRQRARFEATLPRRHIRSRAKGRRLPP